MFIGRHGVDSVSGVTDPFAARGRYGMQLKACAHRRVTLFDCRQRENQNAVAVSRIGEVSSYLIR